MRVRAHPSPLRSGHGPVVLAALAALLLPASAALAGGHRARAAHRTRAAHAARSSHPAPVPLLAKGHPVRWWFVFKFNAHAFPGCGGAKRECLFGGDVERYRYGYSQQFAYASSADPTLEKGRDCLGDATTDPVGATFSEVYNGAFHYVVWNDQFYDDPPIPGCHKYCGSPWGHSKGLLAWNDAGRGFVMQVTTPSWPASGSKAHPRKTVDGDTLGCVHDDDVLVSQDFFALRLTEPDVVKVLTALVDASVVTDPHDPQIVDNGGPKAIQALVRRLGHRSHSRRVYEATLSSGVTLIAKPSRLHVPPWQMVSAKLGGLGLRVASWWRRPEIPSTTASTPIGCWEKRLGKPGPVQIATSGDWDGKHIGLKGGLGGRFNHAKIGVSTSPKIPDVIFGDMNQEGTLSGPRCGRSQNGRGGLFYVVKSAPLAKSVGGLLAGASAPVVTAMSSPARRRRRR